MTDKIERSFPTTFLWGAATASYQIEGAAREDGRSESIWDRFCATPGKVRNRDNGAIACDFYHRYREDIELMAKLGLDAFRFSIAWPRVLPAGRGTPNTRGLDFYDRLVDDLLAHGIRPVGTLYHWDLPQALEDAGGWPSRDTVDAFVEYVDTVVSRLGDRVEQWITHNEPWVAAWLGYGWGVHAPGRTSTADALAAAHHLLLSHGRAVDVIRSRNPTAQVGITLNLSGIYPATESAEDAAAVQAEDGHNNRWFLDPIFRGTYPADMAARFESDMPRIESGDMDTIAAPIDFLGINNYSRNVVKANADSDMPTFLHIPGAHYTDMDWEVYPLGLYDLLMRLHRDYSPSSMVITENGASFPDVRGHDGTVEDPERQAYLEAYIDAVGRAVEDGAPVDGYFVWSLLDNFEWAFGYWKRFGIVYVDYPTLERIPKGSYYWYRDFIERQRARTMRPARAG